MINRDTLTALANAWREEARSPSFGEGREGAFSWRAQLQLCADELAAALALSPPASPTAEVLRLLRLWLTECPTDKRHTLTRQQVEWLVASPPASAPPVEAAALAVSKSLEIGINDHNARQGHKVWLYVTARWTMAEMEACGSDPVQWLISKAEAAALAVSPKDDEP